MLIGLTGRMGSGKSTVAKILTDHGFALVDADAIARRIVDEDEDLLENLALSFGKEILDGEGRLIRQELARRAFATPEGKEKLDSYMLDSIVEAMKDEIGRHRKAGNKKIVIDAPLLFEVGFDEYCDSNWVVVADEQVQIQRVRERDKLTAGEILDRMSRQMTRQEMEERADHVILNNAGKKDLQEKVESILLACGEA